MSNRTELYERACNNSVGEDKKTRYVKMKREVYIARLKTSFLAGAMIAVLATGALVYGGHVVSEYFKEAEIISEELSDYSNLVNMDAAHRTYNNKEYFYDTSYIASELTGDQDNIDKGIYGVYSNIGYNEQNQIEQMDNVIYAIKFKSVGNEEIKKFSNFNDYVVSKGFANEAGKADYNAYEKAMSQMIVNEHNAEELQSQVEDIKNR